MSYLTATDIGFKTQNKVILQEINFQLSLGEFSVILGPNGAGKSTLLRILTGFLQPTQGQVLLQNTPLKSYTIETLSQKRAVMQQQTALDINLTVLDVITFAKPNHSIEFQHDDENKTLILKESSLCDIIEMTECRNLLERDISTLSGGEKQRVLLARTLYQIWENTESGTAIFLDEPTSALDLYYQQHLLKLLKKLSRTKNLAICAILHDANLAALYADTLYIIKGGQQIAHGTPNEVLQHPDFLNWYNLTGGIHYHPIASDTPQIYLMP